MKNRSSSGETVKAVKKPTKPRTSTAKKASEAQVPAKAPTHEEIAQIAYQFWVEGGCQHGRAEEDWYRAQHKL